MKFSVETRFSPDHIEQETFTVFEGVRQTIAREVIQLKDDGVRQALIKLGWTPPVDHKLVPVKPTHEQMMAGYKVSCGYGVLEARAFDLAERMYQAMLAAAPAQNGGAA
jgi:hypothetical protein